jgi:hypothetical protein
MGRFIDLTGKVFGKLIVLGLDIERSKDKPCKYWLCKCSCENETLVSTNSASLNNGDKHSCGCDRAKSWRFINLAGQVYGKITVVELDHIDKENGHYWKCLCDCGNPEYFLVNTRNIRGGKVLSCGCLMRQHKANGLKPRDFEDLTGRIFGRLTVFDFERTEEGIFWLSKCSCENEKIVRCKGYDLKSGSIKSCGCFRAHKLPGNESAFNRLYSTYKTRARDKGFEFDFSKEEFEKITKSNCFYCGRTPFQKAPPNSGREKESYYIYNGIDRIDSKKGYTKENSVPCCGQCNISKNNYLEEDFIEWIRITYLNLKEKGRIEENVS